MQHDTQTGTRNAKIKKNKSETVIGVLHEVNQFKPKKHEILKVMSNSQLFSSNTRKANYSSYLSWSLLQVKQELSQNRQEQAKIAYTRQQLKIVDCQDNK
jgi:hypothetical protein